MANKFRHQILHLQGLIEKTDILIADDLKAIAAAEQSAQMHKGAIQERRKFKEKTQEAIFLLERVGSEEDSKSV